MITAEQQNFRDQAPPHPLTLDCVYFRNCMGTRTRTGGLYGTRHIVPGSIANCPCRRNDECWASAFSCRGYWGTKLYEALKLNTHHPALDASNKYVRINIRNCRVRVCVDVPGIRCCNRSMGRYRDREVRVLLLIFRIRC